MTVKSNHCFVSCCKELSQIHLMPLDILQFYRTNPATTLWIQTSAYFITAIQGDNPDVSTGFPVKAYLCINELRLSKSCARFLWVIRRDLEAVTCKGNTPEDVSKYVGLIMGNSSSKSCLSIMCLYDFTGTLSSCEWAVTAARSFFGRCTFKYTCFRIQKEHRRWKCCCLIFRFDSQSSASRSFVWFDVWKVLLHSETVDGFCVW